MSFRIFGTRGALATAVHCPSIESAVTQAVELLAEGFHPLQVHDGGFAPAVSAESFLAEHTITNSEAR